MTLHASAAAVRRARPRATGASIEPIDEHSCAYRTGDDDLDWLALRIAMLGVDFEVHEPPELARAHAGDGGALAAGGRHSLT